MMSNTYENIATWVLENMIAVAIRNNDTRRVCAMQEEITRRIRLQEFADRFAKGKTDE